MRGQRGTRQHSIKQKKETLQRPLLSIKRSTRNRITNSNDPGPSCRSGTCNLRNASRLPWVTCSVSTQAPNSEATSENVIEGRGTNRSAGDSLPGLHVSLSWPIASHLQQEEPTLIVSPPGGEVVLLGSNNRNIAEESVQGNSSMETGSRSSERTARTRSSARAEVVQNPLNQENVDSILTRSQNFVESLLAVPQIPVIPIPRLPFPSLVSRRATTPNASPRRNCSARARISTGFILSEKTTIALSKAKRAKRNIISKTEQAKAVKETQTVSSSPMFLRAAAKNSPSSCMYAKVGCKEKVSSSEMAKHVAACEYRPYPCPVLSQSCRWRGELKDLMEHFQSAHPDIDRVKGASSKIVVNILDPVPTEWSKVQTYLNRNFLVTVQKLERNGHPQFFAGAKLFGSAAEADTFDFKASLKHKTNKLTYSTRVQPLRDGKEAVTNRDCLLLDLPYANVFSVNNKVVLDVNISHV